MKDVVGCFGPKAARRATLIALVGLASVPLIDQAMRHHGQLNTVTFKAATQAAGDNVLPSALNSPEETPINASPTSGASVEPIDGVTIEALATTNPAQAIARAVAESDPQRQSEWLNAALRGWASIDPDGAAEWIQQHPAATDLGLAAVFEGATQNPPKAIALARRLARLEPAAARDYGYALISALNQKGEYEQSISYAVSDASRWQPDLVINAYHEWGRRQPESALVSAIQLHETPMRQTAIQSVLSGWSRDDPEGLAEAALNFPEGTEKFSALTKAVRAWVIKDPEKARDWILAHDAAVPAAERALRED